MKTVLKLAAATAALIIAPAAEAAVLYSLTGQFTSDVNDDPEIEELETFTWSFSFSSDDYLTTLQNVTPTSCSITGTYYVCSATQFIDPTASSLGGAIDDAFIQFNVDNADGSGGGSANYFFQTGAFAANGVYSDEGQPDPNGPTATGGYVGNAGPATLTVTGDAAPVPEPATWAMMIAGFGLAGGALRRSRRRLAPLPA